MVAVSEPETVVRLDTPAGLVEARVHVKGGRARSVALRNVPSFLLARDRQVHANRGGYVRPTTWPSAATSTRSCPPSPPASPSIPRAPVSWSSVAWRSWRRSTRSIGLSTPPTSASAAVSMSCSPPPAWTARSLQRSATSIHPGWLDRSPCGTGTSAKLAAMHARGEVAVGEEFVNRSVIGTRFGARIVEETDVVGVPAVIPEITGRAWITGSGEYVLDPADPFPRGLLALRSFEAAVVGAGIVGCATAWELARRGVDVCLLDRGDPWRADHRAGGGQRPLLGQGARAGARAGVAGLAVYDELERGSARRRACGARAR